MLSPRPFIFLALAGMLQTASAQATREQSNPPVIVQAVPHSSTTTMTFSVLSLPGPSAALPDQALAKKQLMDEAANMQKAMQSNSRCYTIHSFKFKQKDAANDALQPSGESVCESASMFTLKEAGGPQ